MAMPQPPSKSPQWPEKDELCLLSAVLEIAREPAEAYDPRVNLFDRIGKSLKKPVTNKEVLRKVNELKARYERRRRAILGGSSVVKRTAAFKISEKIWGDEFIKEAAKKKAAKKKAAKSIRTSEDSKKCHGQKVEHLKATTPKPTVCAPKTNPHEASWPDLKRAHEPTEKREEAGPKKRRRGKRGNPSSKQEEDKGPRLNCGKPGNFAHNCPEEEENPAKQKETEELQQPEAENKREEQSSTPISASFQPGSHQITPQQTQQRAEGHNSPQPNVHRICPQTTQQRAESHNSPQPGAHRFIPQKTQQRAQGHNMLNIPQPGAHQLPSDQNGLNFSNSFRPAAHRPAFEQTNAVNRFQHGRSPQHWNRGSPMPPISPPPPATWTPRPPMPTPFPPPPPPQMPYRYPPPHRMNYTLPPNYRPTTNFNQSPAAPHYPMFNPTIPGPIPNFSPSPPPPNPMFNAANLR